MANPGDTGTFNLWIAARLPFQTATPKAGDTGDFEKWIAARIYWHEYVEAVTAPPGLSIPVAMHYNRMRR